MSRQSYILKAVDGFDDSKVAYTTDEHDKHKYKYGKHSKRDKHSKHNVKHATRNGTRKVKTTKVLYKLNNDSHAEKNATNYVISLDLSVHDINIFETNDRCRDKNIMYKDPIPYNDGVSKEDKGYNNISVKKHGKNDENIVCDIDNHNKAPNISKVPNNKGTKSVSVFDLFKKKQGSMTSSSLIENGSGMCLPLLVNDTQKIHRKVSQMMSSLFKNDGIFKEGAVWPSCSPYWCWYCNHHFDEPPVGIPERYNKVGYHLYGNFCSYNCALAYLQHGSDQRVDKCVGDVMYERKQLLFMMCAEINMGLDILKDSVKTAQPRLFLNDYGGWLSIEEFRDSFYNNSEYNAFKPPLVPICYNLEIASSQT